MANVTMKKIRNLRSKGKKQLIIINERLNSLAWELSANNDDINDPNITKAVATMDEALETLQVAMVLLNTVSVDQSVFAKDEAAAAPAAKPAKAPKKSMFGKKPAASKVIPSMESPKA